MKKNYLLVFCLLVSFSAYAQKDQAQLEKEINYLTALSIKKDKAIKSLKDDHNSLLREVEQLKKAVKAQEEGIGIVSRKTDSLSTAITSSSSALNNELKSLSSTTNEKITKVDADIESSKWNLLWPILLALGLSALLYWLFGKKNNSLETKLSDTEASLAEDKLNLDTQLAEIRSKQLEGMKKQQAIAPVAEPKLDHSLALKVAAEIESMKLNLSHMDSKVRGHKQLSKAVQNVGDNLLANGYTVTDLLGKAWDDGMNMIATKRPDPKLEEGQQVITRVVKPEVLFNEKRIQTGEVVVSFGE